MKSVRVPTILCIPALLTAAPLHAQDIAKRPVRAPSEILRATRAEEWRSLDPANTLYVDLPGGQVIIELAPDFAPRHVENIRALARGGYFDGGAVHRVQDNFVAQWAPRRLSDGEEWPAHIRRGIDAEIDVDSEGLPFTPLPDPDTYAPEVGLVAGFPAARDPQSGRAWLVHCYGSVGAARGVDPGSGNGSELVVNIGQRGRPLDRNATIVGQVRSGMEHLSTLPRGNGPLGFHEDPPPQTTLERVRLGTDVPEAERARFQILRTDSESFRAFIIAIRSYTDDFFTYSANRLGVCDAVVPTRPTDAG